MIFAGAGLGSVALGSVMQDPGTIVDPTAAAPIIVDINNVRVACLVDSLGIDDTLGQPMTAQFSLVNPDNNPVEGEPVRIRYHEQILFVGTIDRIQRTIVGVGLLRYDCECKDLSQILERRILRRNFTNLPVQSILSSILDNEMVGEPISIGTIDTRASIPLTDSQKASVFEVCRTLAAATGQTFYVEHDGSIQMRSTTVTSAPLTLSESVVELAGASVKTDRETYRNRQVVIVTGTPPDSNTEALVIAIERQNDNQIADRQSVEGGTGKYDAIEEITHPISNDSGELALFGISFANMRLSASGALRTTITCQVRGYGFRAGQVATVDLPTLNVDSSTVVIQRVSIQEQDGRTLHHQLELVIANTQQRAYEAWLSIVQAGKVVVQIPSASTDNLQSFNTPGTDTWTVPAGVTTVEVTCYGGSGGGGGGAVRAIDRPANGGTGGNSGRAVSIVTVTPGEELEIVVGSAGIAGTTINANPMPVYGIGGGAGTASLVRQNGLVVCQGNGANGGSPGWIDTVQQPHHGANATHASGVGDAVTVGGGKTGGAKGKGWPIVQPGAGQDGLVEVRW